MKRWPAVIIASIIVVISLLFILASAFARDYTNSTLHNWFNGLTSKKGNCCSFADGISIKDVDWDTQNGHYRVRVEGQWFIVPSNALVTVPNKFGPAVVWPYVEDGITKIRCFMPGSMS